jgi:hypothetical protein
MAKFTEPSEHLEKLFTQVVNSTSIPQWVEFKLLCNDKMKILYRIQKLNDAIESITQINFLVLINEEVFDQLEEDHKTIALHEILAGVSVNENDVISLKKHDINTFSGVLSKYGDNTVIAFKESVNSLFDEILRKEEEDKAMRREKRLKKKESA